MPQPTFFNKAYPDKVGKREIFCVSVKGPSSYVNTSTFATSGDPFGTNALGFGRYIDIVFEAMSISGTYIVRGVPAATGNRSLWNLHWFTASSGTEVSNTTNLSAESVQIGGYCGIY